MKFAAKLISIVYLKYVIATQPREIKIPNR